MVTAVAFFNQEIANGLLRSRQLALMAIRFRHV
jgi:hypothetical protein